MQILLKWNQRRLLRESEADSTSCYSRFVLSHDLIPKVDIEFNIEGGFDNDSTRKRGKKIQNR